MMNKQILLIFGIMCCVFVTGCGKISNNVVFHTDGSVSEKLEVEGDRAASGFFRLDMNNEFNKLKSTFTEKNSNAKITDLNNGFLLERKSSDVKELVSKGGTLFNPSEDYGGLRYRKGYFFDTYSLDSVALGQKGNPALDILDGNNFNLNNPYEMAMYTTSKNYIDSAKATFSLSVPSPADYHNATASESDNTLLKWDMKPALLNGDDVPIKVDFRIFTVFIPNEKRGDIDDNLGTWSNGGHSIPIYALFKVDTKSDKVITDAIYSGSGTVNPSHYHSDVHNEKYIHIVNTVITHIDSLRLDMKLRERQKSNNSKMAKKH